MSRIALLALFALSSPSAATADTLEAYAERTSAEPRCKAAAGGEILVCGRREADKYRVPFALPLPPGHPRPTNVHEERGRLIAQESACERLAAMPYGCGMVGLSVSTKLGSGKVELRRLAP